MGRTIVVGDIHGCFDELIDLMSLVNLQTDDRLVAVGDLIAKGPKSAAVLDLFINDSRFSSVLGNHDRLIKQRWRGEPVRLTKEQRQTSAELEPGRERYFNFLRRLPYTIDLGRYLVVHAGLRPGVPLRRQMAADLTEIRTMGADPTQRRGVPWYAVYRGRKTVLFGHWPSRKPRIAAHAIGLDTACVYGGRLTGFIIETREIVSVPARAAYARKR
ncbi:MAG TPA: metallophosphoesterase [Pyrinomonadaceae bacterium]|nr:metallophosphoesterase [Pyrinomonadaceae bacterium]